MADLLEIYNNMVKEASEAEVEKEAEDMVEARMEVLAKYAEYATELLKEEYGEDFAEEDVTKLASMLIEDHIAQEEMEEKVAEYAQAGQIMARAFKDELDKLAAEENKE